MVNVIDCSISGVEWDRMPRMMEVVFKAREETWNTWVRSEFGDVGYAIALFPIVASKYEHAHVGTFLDSRGCNIESLPCEVMVIPVGRKNYCVLHRSAL